VSDILGWLASGRSTEEILSDFEELNKEDIYTALASAADRKNRTFQIAR